MKKYPEVDVAALQKLPGTARPKLDHSRLRTGGTGRFPERIVPIKYREERVLSRTEPRYRAIGADTRVREIEVAPGVFDPRVLVRNQSVMDVNLFATMAARRLAGVGGSTIQRLAGASHDGANPWGAVLAVEASSARDGTPRIATVVVGFGDPARPTAGPKNTLRIPGVATPSIFGGQACPVMTDDGEAVLAAYWLERFSGGARDRKLLLVEVRADGRASMTELPALGDRPGLAHQSYPAAPAIASSPDGAVFLAWPIKVYGAAGVRTSMLYRDGTTWRFSRVRSEEWPVYPFGGDTAAREFEPNLAADYDAVRNEFVLAAVKTEAKPFLARYSIAASLLATPQPFGECTEETHSTVELRVHPVTGNVLMQLQHNWLYFGRAGEGFETLDNRGGPVDLTRDYRGREPCNVNFPFDFESDPPDFPYVRSVGESSCIGIGHSPLSEFTVAGPSSTHVDRLGVLVTNMAWPRRGFVEAVDGVWRGRSAAQQLMAFPSRGIQAVVSASANWKPAAVTSTPVIVGVVR